MIQEKDFLYRVPVKTAPITTPRGQIRNPEILVDLEGGEFMHGNILDANSTNKLINQSVKDAVDDKFIESGYVTKDLLEAETSARTKGDEDLSAKVQAEQTRAEGKEKEISDKLAIVDGDSNTEGSFRKAIADVIAAAPEDLDTLKEIADKLAGNDDLHTALNQAITEKADASALANEVARATGAESGLQAAIATKADATALSNYVLTTALNQQVDTLNAAISAKQDAGNYIPYDPSDRSTYQINKGLAIEYNDAVTAYYSPMSGIISKNASNSINITYDSISLKRGDAQTFDIQTAGISLKSDDRTFSVGPLGIKQVAPAYTFDVNSNDGIKFALGAADDAQSITLNPEGISNTDNNANHVFATDGSIADLTQYALKTELPTVPTKTSQLTNDSNFITATTATRKVYEIDRGISLINSSFKIKDTDTAGGYSSFSSTNLDLSSGSARVIYGVNGIYSNQYRNCVLTTDNEFKSITDFASAEQLQSVESGLSAKQNKITVNEVDVTDIETADITKLRTIVTNLINALSASNLIRETKTLK